MPQRGHPPRRSSPSRGLYAGPWSHEPLAETTMAGTALIYGAEDHLRAVYFCPPQVVHDAVRHRVPVTVLTDRGSASKVYGTLRWGFELAPAWVPTEVDPRLPQCPRYQDACSRQEAQGRRGARSVAVLGPCRAGWRAEASLGEGHQARARSLGELLRVRLGPPVDLRSPRASQQARAEDRKIDADAGLSDRFETISDQSPCPSPTR